MPGALDRRDEISNDAGRACRRGAADRDRGGGCLGQHCAKDGACMVETAASLVGVVVLVGCAGCWLLLLVIASTRLPR